MPGVPGIGPTPATSQPDDLRRCFLIVFFLDFNRPNGPDGATMKSLVPRLLGLALALPLLVEGEPARPPIAGLSHVALYAHDLAASRVFSWN